MAFFSFGKKKVLILDVNDRERWAHQVAEHKELHKELALFRKQLQAQQDTVHKSIGALVKGKSTVPVPERAQHITEQHARAIGALVDTTFENFSFTENIIDFQTHMDAALEALQNFKQHSAKNISALREYYAEQLAEVAHALQELEDLLIKTGERFDKRDYSNILAIESITKKLIAELEKKRRYEQTLNNYLEQQEKNEERQHKHRERIKQQEELVREKNALSALKKVKEIETTDLGTRSRYERLVFDTKHYILKNGLTLNQESKDLFDKLKKNPEGTLRNHHEELKNEFMELHEAMSDLEKEDTKDVVSRLNKAAKDIINDAQKLVNNEKVLHDLKKQILHDVAALNIYEQEQFLLRTKREAEDIHDKIHVLSESLDELQHETYEQELLELTKLFSAVIRGQET